MHTHKINEILLQKQKWKRTKAWDSESLWTIQSFPISLTINERGASKLHFTLVIHWDLGIHLLLLSIIIAANITSHIQFLLCCWSVHYFFPMLMPHTLPLGITVTLKPEESNGLCDPHEEDRITSGSCWRISRGNRDSPRTSGTSCWVWRNFCDVRSSWLCRALFQKTLDSRGFIHALTEHISQCLPMISPYKRQSPDFILGNRYLCNFPKSMDWQSLVSLSWLYKLSQINTDNHTGLRFLHIHILGPRWRVGS